MHFDDDIHPNWLAAGIFKYISQIVDKYLLKLHLKHFILLRNQEYICNYLEISKKFVSSYLFPSCKSTSPKDDFFYTPFIIILIKA